MSNLGEGGSGEKIPWYYQPWVVILLLIFVLGPFGLPLVYKSPKFNRPAKIILTVLTAIFTVYLLWATVEAVKSAGAVYQKYRGILW